ncbi:MAG TPA: hypothetical protein VGI13_00980, partial [Candidatus Acidoferrum sp.]
LEDLPVFCDEEGPHGSPTSDSEKTMVTNATQNILAIVVSFGGGDVLQSSCERMSALLQHYTSGNGVQIAIVS